MKRSDRRGVALIFVLWLLVVLGAIVAEVVSQARLEANILTSLRARTVARYSAENGIVADRQVAGVIDGGPGVRPGVRDRVGRRRRVSIDRAPRVEAARGGGVVAAAVDREARTVDLVQASLARRRLPTLNSTASPRELCAFGVPIPSP